MDSVDEILGELPLPPHVTAEDVSIAVTAGTVHALSSGPTACRLATTAHPTPAACTAGAAGA